MCEKFLKFMFPNEFCTALQLLDHSVFRFNLEVIVVCFQATSQVLIIYDNILCKTLWPQFQPWEDLLVSSYWRVHTEHWAFRHWDIVHFIGHLSMSSLTQWQYTDIYNARDLMVIVTLLIVMYHSHMIKTVIYIVWTASGHVTSPWSCDKHLVMFQTMSRI